MEHDASAEKDEFHKILMEKFSQFKLKRRLKLKEISTFRKVEKNSEEKKMHTEDWSITSRSDCRIDI